MAEDEPQVPEGLELHKNGTVTVVIGEQRITLRRPKLGEFRKLREMLYDAQDRLHEAAEPVRQAGDALKEAQGLEDADLVRQRLTEVQRLNRQYTEVDEDENIAWLRSAFELLGSPLPADADLPVWMIEGSVTVELLQHWRSSPLARGVR